MPKQTFFNLTKEKQDQIINAAIDEFSQCSFNEVKISDIVNKAEIPRTSFYDYFKDKKDLYKYIITIIKDEKMKFMTPILEADKSSFFERFREIFMSGAKFAYMKPEYEKLGRKMYENIEIIKDVLEPGDMDVSSFYESMIIEGIRAGEIRSDTDVKFVAESIYILSFNIMVKDFESNKKSINEFIEEITDKMIDFIKFGISN